MLFDNKSEFNDDFYNNLRSLMDNNMLMLVIVSQKELDFYSKKHQLTSSFFNLGHVLKLGELKEEEAKDLARLPASTVNNASAVLSVDTPSGRLSTGYADERNIYLYFIR